MSIGDQTGLGEPCFSPDEAIVDIVFVHGLAGDRNKTWTTTATKDIPERFWPRDLLPQVCKTARILSFGYNASWTHFYPLYGPKHVSVGTTTDDHSTSLLQSLAGLRDTTHTFDRPLIFVAHSLGGLVCANALSRQHGANEAYKRIVESTRGVVFLGTPFEGSAKARWASVAAKYLDLFTSTNREKIKDMEERSQKLASINEAFLKFLKARDRSSKPVEIACFFEEYPTYIAGKNIGRIVPKNSATLPGIDPLPISANHADLCRFEDEERTGYINISNVLSQWIRSLEAPSWDLENKKHSIHLGETVYYGNVDNKGVVMGNAYTPAKDGIRITGSTTYFYGDNWHAALGQIK